MQLSAIIPEHHLPGNRLYPAGGAVSGYAAHQPPATIATFHPTPGAGVDCNEPSNGARWRASRLLDNGAGSGDSASKPVAHDVTITKRLERSILRTSLLLPAFRPEAYSCRGSNRASPASSHVVTSSSATPGLTETRRVWVGWSPFLGPSPCVGIASNVRSIQEPYDFDFCSKSNRP
ncbi:hypothetical protein LX36DRAFT_382711 [Colletotrichum falcatum]|nr:hypothetical protein LX36DRAFT_382711 [Colletotrichum falcatum]